MLSRHVSLSSRLTRSCRRWHSSYEYPLRTEAPVVTRTLAKDAMKVNNVSVDEVGEKKSVGGLKSKENGQPQLETKLKGSQPIGSSAPSYIPPNVAQSDLNIPTTEITTLPNGLRVASQETYGQVTTVGVLINCGSRYENEKSTGVNHILELLAFSSHDNKVLVQELGGATFASSSREQFLYCIDILRPSVPQAMNLLAQTVTQLPSEEQLEQVKRVIEYQYLDMLPEVMLGEGLQMAAYGSLQQSDSKQHLQQLGRSHLCPLESLPNIKLHSIRDYHQSYLMDPTQMVLAGAGIAHDELVDLAQTNFGHLVSVSNPNEAMVGNNQNTSFKSSSYTGGEFRLQKPTIDGYTRIALAFEIPGGWHSDQLVTACVLQALLGGGNSFSAGGPGKGMYSRLYREVLNRYYWAESAEAFTTFYTESGLLGMTGSSLPTKSRDVVRVLAEHFHKLTAGYVTDEELDRARNMLKCNVLSQLESRLVLFEDIGRQILTYGKREGTKEMCEKIDAVTKEDIHKLCRNAVFGESAKPPTLACVGDDITNVPTQDEVARWFGS